MLLTSNIRLTSAVTVLSAADPVRVFQEFATLDLVSHGRAEIVAGRDSFVESFPLFGLRLEDYDSLFSEKPDLLLNIRENTNVHWSGKHCAPLKDFEQSHLIPPKMQTKLEISRQAELFPSSGFFQPRKVVLFCAIVRVAPE
jgi:alkanesulfonate monooxygenase SsuD/methylene tetrahydromethanopterin reductase-like flavin-dependent oxidoreductase (luciferase family)